MLWNSVVVFLFAAALIGAEREIAPIDVRLEITGYRIEGSEAVSEAVVVVRATNQEQVPISYWSERIERPFIRLSWQENETWIDEKTWMCPVGSREQVLAPGEQREFMWRIGMGIKDAVTGSVSWTWVPTAWPIRVRMQFCRSGSPDWWGALSETSEIDETLRSVMLHAVAVQPVHIEPVQDAAVAQRHPMNKVQAASLAPIYHK